MALAEQKPLQLYASNPPETDDHFVVPMIRAFEKDKDWVVHKFCARADAEWTDEQVWRCNPFIDEYFNTKGKMFANVM